MIRSLLFLLVSFIVMSSCEERDKNYYFDSDTGLCFTYLSTWQFEKFERITTGKTEIVGHVSSELSEYFKQMGIIVLDSEVDLKTAVQTWWLENDDDNMFSNNETKLHFGPIRVHRYNGVSYAANRAQFMITILDEQYPMDYRVMAMEKMVIQLSFGNVQSLEG